MLVSKYVEKWKMFDQVEYEMSIFYNSKHHVVFFKYLFSCNLSVTLKVEIPSLHESYTLEQKIILYPNRFKELDILYNVKGHNNIVKLIYFKVENLEDMVELGEGRCNYTIGWMFNEYLEFSSFQHLVKLRKNNQTSNESGLIKMLKDILSALKECRKKGIVHGDIQLRNIYRRGEDLDLTNIDFVLVNFANSIRVNKCEMEEQVMKNELFLRKPFFAPEVINEQQILSQPSDIWSFGIMIFKLLLNDNSSVADQFSYIFTELEENNTHLVINLCSCSDEVKNFIKKCLKINVEERATAQELLKDPLLN